MATLLQPNNKDKNKEEENNLSKGLGGSSIQGGTIPSQSPRGTSSGRFTNIQNYLSANRQGSQNLGGKVSSNISNLGEQTKTGLGQAQQAFDTGSMQGRLVRGQADTTAKNIIENAGQQVYGDTTTQNLDKIKEFQRIASGQYLGPQGLQNVEQLQGKAREAQTVGNLAGSEAGRYSLLKQMFNNPQYSRGQTKLDQLLLGSQTGQLNQARQLVSNLPQNVEVARQQALGRAGAYGLEAKQVGEQAKSELESATQAKEKELSDLLAQRQAEESELQKQFGATTEGLKADTLSKQNYERLGLSNILQNPELLAKANEIASTMDKTSPYSINPADYQNSLLGLNIQDYLTTNVSPEVTKESVSSLEQAKMRNALNLLGGATPGMDLSKAGTYQASTQTLDQAKLAQDYNKAYADMLDKLKQSYQQGTEAENLLKSYGINRSMDLNNLANTPADFLSEERMKPEALQYMNADPKLSYQDALRKAYERNVGIIQGIAGMRERAVGTQKSIVPNILRTLKVT